MPGDSLASDFDKVVADCKRLDDALSPAGGESIAKLSKTRHCETSRWRSSWLGDRPRLRDRCVVQGLILLLASVVVASPVAHRPSDLTGI